MAVGKGLGSLRVRVSSIWVLGDWPGVRSGGFHPKQLARHTATVSSGEYCFQFRNSLEWIQLMNVPVGGINSKASGLSSTRSCHVNWIPFRPNSMSSRWPHLPGSCGARLCWPPVGLGPSTDLRSSSCSTPYARQSAGKEKRRLYSELDISWYFPHSYPAR